MPSKSLSMWCYYLESDEEGDGLDTVVPTVHVVAHEQIVGVGRLTTFKTKINLDNALRDQRVTVQMSVLQFPISWLNWFEVENNCPEIAIF